MERQADSLDSVEEESTTLPYDTVPIRYDPSGERIYCDKHYV